MALWFERTLTSEDNVTLVSTRGSMAWLQEVITLVLGRQVHLRGAVHGDSVHAGG